MSKRYQTERVHSSMQMHLSVMV